MLFETKNDPILQEDLENIVAGDLPWSAFAGKRMLITGATGLVGGAVTRAICCANRIRGLGVRLVLLVQSAEKARAVFGDLIDRERIELVEGDVRRPLAVDGAVDFILHAAAVTDSKRMVTHPTETIAITVDGTRRVLELAREKQVEGMVYLSSMEVYGQPSDSTKKVSEDDLGFIDHLNVRSCYPESKRMAESLCASAHAEYGVPVKIARLAQTFGAGIAATENRVFAQFARSFLRKENIVLHTAGESWGNYCYTAECVSALLFLMVNGQGGEAYNVVNEQANLRIRDMAEMLANMSDGAISVVFDIPEDALQYGYAPSVELHLSGEKLIALGWTARIRLEEMYRRLIASMQATGNV